MSGNFNMNNNQINNLSTPINGNQAVTKKCVDDKMSSIQSNTDIDLKEKYNIINSKQQSFSHLTANYDDLVSYSDVKDMETSLNMNNNLIHNLKDAVNLDEAVNLKQLQNSMSTKAD